MRSLSDRFEFDEDALASGDKDALQGTLWRVFDEENGSAERRLRTWRKTGTAIDEELRYLWRHEMRQVRRLMRYRDASDVIVDVLEELEDDEEFALLLADRGDPLTWTLRRGRPREVPSGRKRILVWQNLARVARALGILHDQAIVHGRLTLDCIFTEGGREPDFRLSGFEWSIQLGSDAESGPMAASWKRLGLPCSFRADWAALGVVARKLLGEEERTDSETRATELEDGVLSLLQVPRPNQPLDAQIIVRDIEAVVADLHRLEGGRRGQLLLLPNPATLGPTLISHLGVEIDPDDFEAHCNWIQADLGSDVRVAARHERDERLQCELVTDAFRYIVEPMRHVTDWRVGYLKLLIPNDGRGTGTAEPRQLHSPVTVVPNRKEASATAQRLGPSAIEWDQFSRPPEADELPPANVRDALFAIEVIEAVAATLDAFPVCVENMDSKSQRVVLKLQSSSYHTQLIAQAGLRPDAERLPEMLARSDDTPWRLSNTAKLGWGGDGDADVDFVETDTASGGGQVYVFECSGVPEGQLYLKPPRELGTESQIRRRLRNISLLDGRADVTVGLDDPWTSRRIRPAAELRGKIDATLDKPKRAALSIIAETEPYVYVVGPPGVGKTYLVSRMLKQILENKPNARVLVTAQSHEALKNIHETLTDALDSKAIVVRIGNNEDRFAELDRIAVDALQKLHGSEAVAELPFQNFRLSLDKTLTEYRSDQSSRPAMISRVGDLMMHSANVVLAGLNSMTISDFVETSEEFDWVIVEEAARALGPELAGALALGPRKVLIGDHNQLPPHKADEVARRFEPAIAGKLLAMAEDRLSLPSEGEDLLPLLRALVSDDERFKITIGRANRLLEPFRTMVTEDEQFHQVKGDRHRRISMTLTEQRRMHPTIAKVVSEVFYAGQLTTAKADEPRPVPFETNDKMPAHPIVVVDFPTLQSTNRKDPFEKKQGRSTSNPSEADEVIQVAKCLLGVSENGTLPTLAILSPYKGQVELLQQKLLSSFPQSGAPTGFQPVREDLGFVGTVDAFQGSEADVVILSMVRNNSMVGGGGLGFLRDRRRMNVALSRAKHKLIIVGSLKFLDLAAKGMNPKGNEPKWAFLRNLVKELREREGSPDGVYITKPGGLS